jgi:hypothetical protein
MFAPACMGRRRRGAAPISANLFWVFFVKTPTKTPSSAVSRDRSVARSAQDGRLRGELEMQKKPLLGFLLSAKHRSIEARPGTLRILGEPVMFFDLGSALFHGWRILFAPGGVVPGNRLESVVAGLKSHGRLSSLILRGVKGN